MSPEGRILISDIGMSPRHWADDPPRWLDNVAELYDLFTAPEVETDYELVQRAILEPSADVYSCGMLFVYLLHSIELIQEPRTPFRTLAYQIRNGDIPLSLPPSVIVKIPTPFLDVLWGLIRQMLGPVELRPHIDVVCEQLEAAEKWLESSDLEDVPLISLYRRRRGDIVIPPYRTNRLHRNSWLRY